MNRRRRSALDERGRVELARGHQVAGNPNRFTDGEVAIRADDEWRAQMPRRDRLAVTALTLPALAGLGLLRKAG